jgi:hypothetical protein
VHGVIREEHHVACILFEKKSLDHLLATVVCLNKGMESRVKSYEARQRILPQLQLKD